MSATYEAQTKAQAETIIALQKAVDATTREKNETPEKRKPTLKLIPDDPKPENSN